MAQTGAREGFPFCVDPFLRCLFLRWNRDERSEVDGRAEWRERTVTALDKVCRVRELFLGRKSAPTSALGEGEC